MHGHMNVKIVLHVKFLMIKYEKEFTSRSPTDKNTKHTQMTYTCGHILCNNTNSTNANQREE